jgi:hypothetical protein
MIFTVNANAAIDHVLFVEDLEKRGTIRAARSLDAIGGKGADNALVLARLGAPHRLISFMAGSYGRILEDLYRQNGNFPPRLPCRSAGLPPLSAGGGTNCGGRGMGRGRRFVAPRRAG